MPNEKITLFFSQLELKLNELPLIVGNEVVNYSLEAFDRQAWENAPWKARQSKKDSGRSILIKSGRLKRSIRIISSSPSSVIVGSDVPYAAIHNNGGIIGRAPRSETFKRPRFLKGDNKGAFRKFRKEERLISSPVRGLTFKAYNINMPQRRYLGITPELKERIRQRVIKELKSKP